MFNEVVFCIVLCMPHAILKYPVIAPQAILQHVTDLHCTGLTLEGYPGPQKTKITGSTSLPLSQEHQSL